MEAHARGGSAVCGEQTAGPDASVNRVFESKDIINREKLNFLLLLAGGSRGLAPFEIYRYNGHECVNNASIAQPCGFELGYQLHTLVVKVISTHLSQLPRSPSNPLDGFQASNFNHGVHRVA